MMLEKQHPDPYLRYAVNTATVVLVVHCFPSSVPVMLTRMSCDTSGYLLCKSPHWKSQANTYVALGMQIIALDN